MVQIKKIGLLCVLLSVIGPDRMQASFSWLSGSEKSKKNSQKQLEDAIKDNDFETIKFLVDQISDDVDRSDFINFQNDENYGSTALMQAIKDKDYMLSDDIQIIRYLIDNGADVNAPNDGGWTPLMQAARLLRLDMVKVLLDAGAQVNNLDNENNSALILALRRKCYQNDEQASNDQIAIVKLLIKSGAFIDKVGSCGRSALQIAKHGSRYGYLDPAILQFIMKFFNIEQSPSFVKSVKSTDSETDRD